MAQDSAARREYLREYQRRWVERRRREWLRANGPCVQCGSSVRLEVDHVDPTLKRMNAAELWSLAPDNPKRVAELAECQVLCHSCHLAKTAAYYKAQMKHGTRGMYERHGCRCDKCKAAKAIHNRQRNKNK